MIKELFNVIFFRVVILMALAAGLFYMVYPKYYVKQYFRYNKITGTVEEEVEEGKWAKH